MSAPELRDRVVRTEYREIRAYIISSVSDADAREQWARARASRTTCDDVEYSEENLLSVELHEE